MDIHTRVTAFQSCQAQLYSHITFRNISIFFKLDRNIQVCTAGTTDKQFAFFFRIAVNQCFSFQETGLQTESTIHSFFFIDREKSFYRSMLDSRIRKHCHSQRSTDAIVGTQCRLTGCYPVAIYISINRVSQKIMFHRRIFLGNHIQVRLQDYSFAAFHSGSGRFTDQNVSCSIPQSFQSQSFSKSFYKTSDCFHVSCRTGDLCEVIEITPDMLRGKILDFC